MRGQAAFEYLMLFSIALVILAFLTSYASETTSTGMEEISVSNAVIAVKKIAEASDIVYTQGKPSQITFTIYIPSGVTSVEFVNRTVMLRMNSTSGANDIFATSKAPLQGNISAVSGSKRIRIRAEVNYVNITEV